MDYDTYRKSFFADPQPMPRFRFSGSFGVTLFFEDFKGAAAYYSAVLGPPTYVEGPGTLGWPIGTGWLTLLQGTAGSPTNVEVTFQVDTPTEADRLQAAFITAGGTGPAPSNGLMYAPIRYCPVKDPFGVMLLVISPAAPDQP